MSNKVSSDLLAIGDNGGESDELFVALLLPCSLLRRCFNLLDMTNQLIQTVVTHKKSKKN